MKGITFVNRVCPCSHCQKPTDRFMCESCWPHVRQPTRRLIIAELDRMGKAHTVKPTGYLQELFNAAHEDVRKALMKLGAETQVDSGAR